jgi:DNA-binding NarL/FixJ family response regulator
MTPDGQTPKKSRIIVVEDHPLVCAGLMQLIGSQPDLTCAGVADNTCDAKRVVGQRKPDLMLLSILNTMISRLAEIAFVFGRLDHGITAFESRRRTE